MNNASVFRLALVLILIGLSVFFVKWLVIGFPLTSGKIANAWGIETEVRFSANGGPVSALVFLPSDSAGQEIRDLRLVGGNYGNSMIDEPPNKQALFTIRKASGEQSFNVQFVARIYPKIQNQLTTKARAKKPLLVGVKKPVMRQPKLLDTEIAAARSLLEIARKQSADVSSMITILIKTMQSSPRNEIAQQLVGAEATSSKIADKVVATLFLGNISARIVHGIDVSKPGRNTPILTWVEVWLDKKWVSFSVRPGKRGVPRGYLAWWRGTDPLVSIDGGENPTRRILIRRLRETELRQVLLRGKKDQSFFTALSLYNLPANTQELYKILLMIPVGVLFLVVLRNLIGIKGLGTFMPVLIAIAFRQTTLAWGIVLFTAIVSVGLLLRLYLEHLRLLVAPRLGAILIVVILLMALISVVASKLGFDRGLAIALFPVVILSMTIERISIIWDERGPSAATWEAAQSLIIATLCYLVMLPQALQYLIFTFPELSLILLATILLIGRYTGFRLLELSRFRALSNSQ